MKGSTAKIASALGIAIFSLGLHPIWGKTVASRQGTLKDSTAKLVSNAGRPTEDVTAGQATASKINLVGIYSDSSLPPGVDGVSVSADEWSQQALDAKPAAAKAGPSEQMASFDPQQQQASPNKLPSAPQPNQPAGNASDLSLQSLGFGASQIQGSAKEQALLNKRTHMLKVHQTLGLITAIPMVATLITGPMAKAKGKHGEPITEPTSANLDFHMALGGLTTGLYFTTAYYAIFAPKVPGVKPKGAIRLHRDLVWIHGPGMIITPILGIMAYKQESAGEKVHGIASAHGAAGVITAAAYGASIIAVSWPIHWKFWER